MPDVIEGLVDRHDQQQGSHQQERAANGHAAPWTVPFIGVGNESWGCGGNMTADTYATAFRHYAAFLRAYEDGKPVASPNHLKWNPNAPVDGEVTFVAGNPGSTSRLLTMAQLEVLRDQQLPITLIQTSELRGRLLEYSTTGEEAKLIANELRNWVAKEIGPIAKPKDIRFGDNLPKTRSGKIMRRLLRSIAKGEAITQDTSTLENPAILDQLAQTN